MAQKMTEDEFGKLIKQAKLLGIGFVGLFLLPLIIYGVYLDRRLAGFEEALRHSPPDELETAEVFGDGVYQLATTPLSGQVVYVPAYSHVYHRKGEPYLLTVTLSIRNTSVDSEIVVRSVRYFDTKGKEVKSYLKNAVRLPALGTTEIIVERDDAVGGSGANFLVEWHASEPVTEPVIESVMIDTNSQQGISFVRRGVAIQVFQPNAMHEIPTADQSVRKD